MGPENLQFYESLVLLRAVTHSLRNKVLDLDFAVVPSSLSQFQRPSNDKETIKCCLKFLLSFLRGISKPVFPELMGRVCSSAWERGPEEWTLLTESTSTDLGSIRR